jgi:hypothetical protein
MSPCLLHPSTKLAGVTPNVCSVRIVAIDFQTILLGPKHESERTCPGQKPFISKSLGTFARSGKLAGSCLGMYGGRAPATAGSLHRVILLQVALLVPGTTSRNAVTDCSTLRRRHRNRPLGVPFKKLQRFRMVADDAP